MRLSLFLNSFNKFTQSGTLMLDPLFLTSTPGLEVIKLEYSLRLKIKHNDLLLADTCLQAANHCALF